MGCCRSKKTGRKLHNLDHASKTVAPRKLTQSVDADPKILILGAGVAGLACAIELQKHGFNNIRIVEMSGRIGGRIRTMKFADNYVDLGAQWVYGQRDNAVYTMMRDHKALESSADFYIHTDWIRSNGERMPDNMVAKLVNVFADIYRNKRPTLMEECVTFGEYLMTRFAEQLSRPDLQELDRMHAAEFLRTFKKMEGSAIDKDMCASCYDTYIPCPGEIRMNWRDKGFKQFLQMLVNGDEMNLQGDLTGCIDLNTRVTQVEWDRKDGSLQVTCENKEKYVVDHVIVTVSLGVLKHNKNFFQPNLPQVKRKAINFIGFSSLCKIFVEFEEPFWPNDWRGFNAMWRTEDLNQPPSQSQSPEEQQQLEWITDIYAFHVYAHQPRVLLAWAAGDYTDLIESLDGRQLSQGVQLVLRQFLPEMKIPQPKRVVSSKWSTDPAYHGSYSYPSLLTKDYNTGPEQLAQPVNIMVYEEAERLSWDNITPMSVRPIILFAGEATSPQHYSTVHGAVETGVREARRLCGYYQKEL